MRAYGPTDEIPSKVLTKIGHRSSTYYTDKIAARYRQNDLREHISAKMWGKMISRVASSFPEQISVLDLGCGTGRYFHCVKNAERYVGVDASPAMLELAKSPLRKNEITASRIYLVRADIYGLRLQPATFDFIFSIGVFGDHVPLTVQLCDNLRSMLRPGGKALFTVMDAKTPHPEGGLKRKLALTIYPFLSKSLKSRVDVRIANFTHTEEEVRVILDNSGFASYKVTHSLDQDPNHEIWDRYWFICEARK
jgi:SAM-dependent methyltransferase